MDYELWIVWNCRTFQAFVKAYTVYFSDVHNDPFSVMAADTNLGRNSALVKKHTYEST